MRPTRFLLVAFLAACSSADSDFDKGESAPLIGGKADLPGLIPEGILQPSNTRTLDVGDAQGFTFYGTPGAKVTLTMVAAKPGCGRSTTRLDTYLYLWDSNGKTIASNDDAHVGGGSCNSQIADFELPNAGPFAVVATSWAQGSGGTYTLTFTCAGCAGPTGSFSNQTLTVGGEVRSYWLHVPPSYDGSKPLPLLVDFHGTASVADADTGIARPEEYYALDELVAVADREGFIVVRPRSRALHQTTSSLYQWDVNDGDLPKNVAFTRALVSSLAARYQIDAGRTYAFGFSNGTNMAMQFLADDPPLFHGYAAVGGGVWNEVTRGAFGPDAPRMWLATGFRDYMYQWFQNLYVYLSDHSYPTGSKIFIRFTDAGHELYGWHYAELFAWLDRGEVPAEGAAGPGWSEDGTLSGSDGITHLAAAANGDVVAVGSSGGIYHRTAASGAWSEAGRFSDAQSGFLPPFTGVCMFPSGRGVAVAGGTVAATPDNGATWQLEASAPETVPMGFGHAQLNAVACTGTSMVGTGYWAAVSSTDEGRHWSAGSMDNGGYAAQGATVAVSSAHTWLAGGYYHYLGRSTDGVTFTRVTFPGAAQWLDGIAPAGSGVWAAVGEAGTVIGSIDDGVTWTARTSPRADDLYAVSFRDASTGLAVGAHGAALLTSDGGAHWTDVSLGQDVSLNDVLWTSDGSALVAGTRSKVLRYRPNN